MTTVIKKGSSIRTINKVLAKLLAKQDKGFDAKKFCGALKLKKDALLIQKDLRNEW